VERRSGPGHDCWEIDSIWLPDCDPSAATGRFFPFRRYSASRGVGTKDQTALEIVSICRFHAAMRYSGKQI
jgi:hypothetical protein